MRPLLQEQLQMQKRRCFGAPKARVGCNELLAAIGNWKRCETESKTVSHPCLKNLSLSVELFFHTLERVVTGIVS